MGTITGLSGKACHNRLVMSAGMRAGRTMACVSRHTLELLDLFTLECLPCCGMSSYSVLVWKRTQRSIWRSHRTCLCESFFPSFILVSLASYSLSPTCLKALSLSSPRQYLLFSWVSVAAGSIRTKHQYCDEIPHCLAPCWTFLSSDSLKGISGTRIRKIYPIWNM